MTPCDKKSVVPKSLEEREVNQGSGGAGRGGGKTEGGRGVDIDRGQGGSASRGGAELERGGRGLLPGLELWSAYLGVA